jgi:hypothetical protein
MAVYPAPSLSGQTIPNTSLYETINQPLTIAAGDTRYQKIGAPTTTGSLTINGNLDVSGTSQDRGSTTLGVKRCYDLIAQPGTSGTCTGSILAYGTFSCGTNAATCGILTAAGNSSFSGNLSLTGGTNSTLSTGQISASSSITGKNLTLTDSANPSLALSNGGGISCGPILASGTFSSGTNAATCGALSVASITSSGSITSNGANAYIGNNQSGNRQIILSNTFGSETVAVANTNGAFSANTIAGDAVIFATPSGTNGGSIFVQSGTSNAALKIDTSNNLTVYNSMTSGAITSSGVVQQKQSRRWSGTDGSITSATTVYCAYAIATNANSNPNVGVRVCGHAGSWGRPSRFDFVVNGYTAGPPCVTGIVQGYQTVNSVYFDFVYDTVTFKLYFVVGLPGSFWGGEYDFTVTTQTTTSFTPWTLIEPFTLTKANADYNTATSFATATPNPLNSKSIFQQLPLNQDGSGVLTVRGSLTSGTNAATCGALSATSITASGTFSSGTNAATCGALSATSISSSGTISCGSNALTSGIINASGVVGVGMTNTTTTGNGSDWVTALTLTNSFSYLITIACETGQKPNLILATANPAAYFGISLNDVTSFNAYRVSGTSFQYQSGLAAGRNVYCNGICLTRHTT